MIVVELIKRLTPGGVFSLPRGLPAPLTPGARGRANFKNLSDETPHEERSAKCVALPTSPVKRKTTFFGLHKKELSRVLDTTIPRV